jgi:AP-4 complex subunit mu-1
MVNVSPSLLLELLQRIARVTKDYLGVLNEDSLRKNFILVYELLDEVIVSALHYILHQYQLLSFLT